MYKRKRGTDSSDGLVPKTPPSTPTTLSDNLNSTNKGSEVDAKDQTNAEENNNARKIKDEILPELMRADQEYHNLVKEEWARVEDEWSEEEKETYRTKSDKLLRQIVDAKQRLRGALSL